MRWSIVPVTATVVAAMVMLEVDRAVGQDATPATSPIATVTCAVEPRPTDELLALWFGPGGAPVGTPGSSGTAVPELTLPQGEPADEETMAAVDAIAREFFTCFATDQNTRGFALMSDRLVRLFVPSDTLEQTRIYLEHVETQAVGTPAAEAEEITVAPCATCGSSRMGGSARSSRQRKGLCSWSWSDRVAGGSSTASLRSTRGGTSVTER